MQWRFDHWLKKCNFLKQLKFQQLMFKFEKYGEIRLKVKCLQCWKLQFFHCGSILKKIGAFSTQSETLSALKVKCFHPNFAIFFTHFCHQQWKCYKIHILPGNAEYFKRFKIHRITFGILWLKSQFQPDFANTFFIRVSSFL